MSAKRFGLKVESLEYRSVPSAVTEPDPDIGWGTALELPDDDHMTIAGRVSGWMAGDTDRFRFRADPGQRVQVRLNYPRTADPFDTWRHAASLQLSPAIWFGGSLLATATTGAGGTEAVLSAVIPSGGTTGQQWDIEVWAAGPIDWMGRPTATYNLQIDRSPAPADPDDQLREATQLGRVGVPQTRPGSIDPGNDVDLYAIDVDAGQRVAFDLDRPSGTLDARLRVFDPTGKELADNDTGTAPGELPGPDPYLEYTFPAAGRYYVGVSAAANRIYDPVTGWGDWSGTTGGYNLTVGSPAKPDLIPKSARTVTGGVRFEVAATRPVGPVRVAVYQSADLRFDPTDTPVGDGTITPWLNATTAGEVRFAGFTPAPQRPYLLLVLDPQHAVAEEDEGNNVTAVRQASLAWGSKVSAEFAERVRVMGTRLGVDPNFLMSVMAFETGETFSPSVKNAAGSGAVGLIQFMPTTAKAFGTTTAALALMSAVEQLDYVERYLAPYKGRLHTVADTYMVVLYPKAVDQAGGYVLFRKGTTAYTQNKGLDADKDGLVTKYEAAAVVRAKLTTGLRPGYAG